MVDYEDYTTKIADKLANKLGLTLKKELGSGLQGTAYLLSSGRVLKITEDVREYHICSSIIGKNIKHIYNIDATYRLLVDGEECFGIIEEELDTRESKSINAFERKTGFGSNCRDYIEGSLEEYEFLENFERVKSEYPKYKFFTEQFYEIIKATILLGITSSDMHSNNVGRKGDHLVLFDLGFSDSGVEDEGNWLELIID